MKKEGEFKIMPVSFMNKAMKKGMIDLISKMQKGVTTLKKEKMY